MYEIVALTVFGSEILRTDIPNYSEALWFKREYEGYGIFGNVQIRQQN